VAIRNMAIPLFGGGALIIGYALFSRWRTKRTAVESKPPVTLRESGSGSPGSHSEPRDGNESEIEALEDPGPYSERSPRVSDILELDDLEPIDEFASEHEPSLHDAVAPEDIGALFLARVTDALSPFGSRAGHGQFELDQFGFESGLIGEATARAANGEEGMAHGARDRVAESERRPSPPRPRGRS